MGLDELISDSNDVHPKSVKARNKKLRDENVCPECGSEETKEGITFDRCLNNSCDVMSFRHPEYEVNYSKLWD